MSGTICEVEAIRGGFHPRYRLWSYSAKEYSFGDTDTDNDSNNDSPLVGLFLPRYNSIDEPALWRFQYDCRGRRAQGHAWKRLSLCGPGGGDKTDLSTWRVENKLVPLLDPLTCRQGQLASLVLINGISNSTVRANVESSIAPHMPFDSDDGAVTKFRHFAQPSCFSRLPATPSVLEQTHGVNMTGRSTNGHPRSRTSGPSRRRPHCEHRSHRLEECLKQHYCSDCDHWGYKTGDCELARDHFALLRAYGYSGGGGRSGGNGDGQGKRGKQPTG
uniref:Uncharacterized protein n=1 Tax=Chromera velia CCMP2878 TaxID=1169474 RepID=A0A0G4FS93_9ALVE|eukprot:Cvel_3682.t1-p1 / transcript=Cvel_3682.t1 / gene=Cvel_3682 / organism=Chromera_velia_CCMP2878 / gene_product=hypothetical protein / transcript_product=hypothetical protein / location=Cvel_scaffold153:14637-20796(-) / protein_length=273 / sequence_SO=supercontig / SO=protein_coding / is_pseudo=false